MIQSSQTLHYHIYIEKYDTDKCKIGLQDNDPFGCILEKLPGTCGHFEGLRGDLPHEAFRHLFLQLLLFLVDAVPAAGGISLNDGPRGLLMPFSRAEHTS